MLNNEILKDVPNYEGIYKVSNLGYITNGRKTLKVYINNSGYSCLKLTGNQGKKSVLLHRVVAQVFIENPMNKPEVNHKDGNKQNCSVSNLEWVTSSENKLHSLQTGLRVYNKPTLGIAKGKSSNFHNVSWDNNRGKWLASIRHNGKTHMQKRFDSEEDAARHVNLIIDTLGLTDRPKNFI